MRMMCRYVSLLQEMESFVYMPRNGKAGSYGNFICSVLRNIQSVFPKWLHSFIFLITVFTSSLSPISCQCSLLLIFLMLIILSGVRENLSMHFSDC